MNFFFFFFFPLKADLRAVKQRLTTCTVDGFLQVKGKGPAGTLESEKIYEPHTSNGRELQEEYDEYKIMQQEAESRSRAIWRGSDWKEIFTGLFI